MLEETCPRSGDLDLVRVRTEDEGNHGNDDTRCFILSTLASQGRNKVHCVLCEEQLLVFDRYPLVDGTFFLSPRQHAKSCIEYLGFNQNVKIDHTQVKTILTQEFRDRLIKLLKTKLNSRNLTKAINTFAIPVLTYSFGIIKWSHTDIENIHILMRKQFTKHRMSHPNICKERLTIERKQGGRGIIDIQSLHTRQIKTLRHFFLSKQTDLHRAIVKADKNYTPLTLSRSSHAADTHNHIQSQQEKINTWTQKALHGKHRYHVTQDHINDQQSYTWLQDGQLFAETEGFMLAIQDQVISTRNYKKCIIKDPSVVDDNCRKCHQQKETIDHITSGCRTLAGTEYTARHNSAAKVIHQALATTNQLIENNNPYYNYTPTSVLENNRYKLYWDVEIHTDKTIPANRPDIVFQSKADRVTYLIDINNIHVRLRW
nr:unnamed protein product [Callosobruchus analis]